MDNSPKTSPDDSPDTAVGIPAPEGATELIDTDYRIGQDNYQASPVGIRIDIHGAVFTFSALVVLAFVVLALALPDQSTHWFGVTRDWINNNLS